MSEQGSGGGSRRTNNIWGSLALKDARTEMSSMGVDRRSQTAKETAATSWQAQLEEEGMEEVMNSMSKNSMMRSGLQPRGVESYLNRRVGPAKTIFTMKRKHDGNPSTPAGDQSSSVPGNMKPGGNGNASVRVTATAARRFKNPFGLNPDKGNIQNIKKKLPNKSLEELARRDIKVISDAPVTDLEEMNVDVEVKKEFVYVSDSDLSEGDLSDESYQYMARQIKKKKVDFRRRAQRDRAIVQEASDKKDDEATPNKRARTAATTTTSTANLDKKTERAKRREEYRALSDEEFKKIMLKKLSEQKQFLIENAFKIFGREVCAEKFLKTMKIEFYGGLLQKNGRLRRTRGGTFMYLIKNDAKIIPEAKKDEFNQINEESENAFRLRREELRKKAGHVAPSGEKEMQAAVLARVNKSVVDNKRSWNIEGKEFCAPTLAGRRDDDRPKREVVDYSEAEFLGDSIISDLFSENDSLF